ncbi:RICIN domain-containing protein [Bacillus cereus]|uniref:RICIN domain-containing protein n=1 Tax=Bacillus cereus TaxID=1396 RepID=UPI0009AB0B60|nr:RICIN domain-containing protein [Bacillus cereus]
MPNLEKGIAYNIALGTDPSLVFDILGNSTEFGSIVGLYAKGQNSINQQFFFFELDGGRMAIVPRNSGRPLEPGFGATPDTLIVQGEWTGLSSQQWGLQDKTASSVHIFNQSNGLVVSYGRNDQDQFPELNTPNPSGPAPERAWYLEPAYQAILPNFVPTTSIYSPPQYSSGIYEVLPDQSEVATVSNALIPCILVNDGALSPETKVQQSPYYLLIKQQFWQKAAFGTVSPNSIREFSFKAGTTFEDQKSMSDTINMTVGGDFGLQFNEVSTNAKFGISQQIQTAVSTTNEELSELTETLSYNNIQKDTLVGVSIYQLVTRYVLYRANGSLVAQPWKFIDNASAVTVITEQPIGV